MASYEIPESVIGIPLFVPDAHDFFSIEAGGMPNGDDCLVIHGDVSSDYKAYQAAQVLTPNAFVDPLAVYSISFWIKGPSSGAASSTNLDSILFGSMNSSFASLTGGNKAWLFGVTDAARNLNFLNHPTSVSSASMASDTGAIDGAWHLIVMNKTGTHANTMIRDLAASGDVGAANGATISNQFFCIGAYSDQAGVSGYPQEWRLGKLAFHDHALNTTERAVLYTAMMGV